ncbi:6-hydroxymethylpterin diphosphokinase MptE-like protein [Pseudoalteromonas xiamenensis]|uniref:Motility associated factor glycosyltransferase family protein n=1 Tax=Pseudoalteromonas xiamenensis TaxID=882626 RepID=A0A975DH59_9GAMM|nr:6-hydroxymethylpterin diphosphokinase MptE-like protein [Pseudoalteromonas xiamenensis]QTH71032.1 motility associated factor glycosyltransferase family protein [Pseudoalteromonas xiamenensis]
MNEKQILKQLESLDKQLTSSVEHQKREAAFAVQANERFELNQKCFEQFFPEIYKVICDYQVRSDFCIHVTESGHGNVQQKGFDVPLYSQNPYDQAKRQVEKHTLRPFYSLTDYSNYPDDPNDNRTHVKYMSKLGRYFRDVRADEKEMFSALPEYFPSAIIFGIGLGYHIEILLEKHHFDYLFLIEPDIELFFASMFCTDWYKIIEKIDKQNGCLFFHLGTDQSNFIKDLEVVAQDIGAFSLVRSFCLQHAPNKEINELIQQWVTDFSVFQFGHGFFNDAITGLAHSIHLVEQKAHFLTQDKAVKTDLDTPIFIIGNGPSLDEAEEFIKKNHTNAIIVAAGTAVATLYKKGIPVDFHVLVERPLANYKIFGDILPLEEYQKINLLGLNTLYPDNSKRYKWSGIATKGNEAGSFLLDVVRFYECGQTLPCIPYSNPVVANTALSFFLYFGFKNVYLFGVDNGNLPTGQHHSKDSIYKLDQDDEEESGYQCMAMEGKTLPGNLGGYVISNELFMSAHRQLEKLVDTFAEQNVFNIGSGAKLTNALALAADELLDLPSSNKLIEVENIKCDFFEELPFNHIDEKYIAIERFKEISDHLLEISRTPFTTRAEAADILKRQSRYLYAFRSTPFNHLFHILKGAMLYYHCPLVTLLFSYQDEQYTLNKFKGLLELWDDYVMEMRDYYQEHYYTKCDLEE